MRYFYKGLLLILLMFGHNYVINQPQALQREIQSIHKINVTQFNLLYSLPSALSILFIIPLGMLYDRYSLLILIIGAFSLMIGQIFVTIFTPKPDNYSYQLLIGGRIFEGVGAEVLYMIQGNLASTWMGKLAGLIFILPQLGEIGNVFGTPFFFSQYGIDAALYVGLITCAFSTFACFLLYIYLKQMPKRIKLKQSDESQRKIVKSQIQMQKNRNSDKSTVESERSRIEYNTQETSLLNCLQQSEKIEKLSILKAGKIFWLTIAVCAINQCLYFPFLDNANEMLQKRFCILYEKTGLYLCLPFIAAITITAIHGEYVLHRISRHKLIFICSFIPFVGHGIIYLTANCQNSSPSIISEILLILGLSLFGIGLGSYYSISFPAVGYAVPESIRGTAYACLCFFQTLSMALVPILSGLIIGGDDDDSGTSQSYKNSSLLFIFIALIGTILSLAIYCYGNSNSYSFHDSEQDNQQQHQTPLIDDRVDRPQKLQFRN